MKIMINFLRVAKFHVQSLNCYVCWKLKRIFIFIYSLLYYLFSPAKVVQLCMCCVSVFNLWLCQCVHSQSDTSLIQHTLNLTTVAGTLRSCNIFLELIYQKFMRSFCAHYLHLLDQVALVYWLKPLRLQVLTFTPQFLQLVAEAL